MTIAIAAKTTEGVILGTDSTTTCNDAATGKLAQLFNSAQKIFEIGPSPSTFVAGYHFSGGIATFGDGQCGPHSWRSIVSDFYREIVAPIPDSTDLPQAFLKFVQGRWAEFQASGTIPAGQPIPDTGFFLAYVAASQGTVRAAQVSIRAATVADIPVGSAPVGCGAEVVNRILLGFDGELRTKLVAAGVAAPLFDALAATVRIGVPINIMPLRDGIDFVHFLIYSTIKLHRYRGAAPSIGGPIEIAAVTADRGFRWIMHKPLSESIGVLHGRESL